MKEDLPREYQKGFTKFLGCRIDLSKRVLIPRPETEFWVREAIKELSSFPRHKGAELLKILDIFSGSGCIGIAILKKVKKSRADFVDVEKRAVQQIEINLRINQIPSERGGVYQSDLFKRLRGKRYDFIFANPPYVAKDRIKEVQPSVLKYEPKKALFAGKGGLDVIRRFLKEAKNHLKERGIIFMEFDPVQKRDIELILRKEGYNKFKFKKDQFDQWRWLKIFS